MSHMVTISTLSKAGVAHGHVYALNVFERASDGDKALAGGVVELNSCRSRRAAAAVVRGAAAQAYYKALGPAARRIGQQLSNAKGRGAARVLVVADHRQSGRSRHFQHGGRSVVYKSVIAAALLEPGAGNLLGDLLAADSREEGVNAALAAVCNGYRLHGAAGEYLLNALGHQLANTSRRNSTLKRIGYENCLFQCTSLQSLTVSYKNCAGPGGAGAL